MRQNAVPHADRGAVVLIEHPAARAFKVGPDVGRVREMEVGAKPIFHPRVLAVDFIDRAVAARDGGVAQELMNGGNAEVSRVAVFRALKAEREAARPIRLSASSKRYVEPSESERLSASTCV